MFGLHCMKHYTKCQIKANDFIFISKSIEAKVCVLHTCVNNAEKYVCTTQQTVHQVAS